MSTPSGHSAATPSEQTSSVLEFANAKWRVRRPKPFVLVIEGEIDQEAALPSDYLHDTLLLPEWREAFYQLVDATGLVAHRSRWGGAQMDGFASSCTAKRFVTACESARCAPTTWCSVT